MKEEEKEVFKRVKKILSDALKEDIGTGDITTNYLISKNTKIKAAVYSKSDGIIAGLDFAKIIFQLLDKNIKFKRFLQDGDTLKNNQKILEVKGSTKAILSGERTALNILQRLSGIATITFSIVSKVKKYNVKILDTRKTTPNFRYFEKYAVKVGGGENHRFGLYDGILIKDNHIKVVGSIKRAVEIIRNNNKNKKLKIEVETQNLQEVKEALSAGVDIIMLDNMDIQTIKLAKKIIGNSAKIEVSGNVNENNIIEIAKTGVDYISIGLLTHSPKILDMSLEIIE